MAIFDWNHAKLNAQADEFAPAIDRFANGDLSGAFQGSSELTKRYRVKRARHSRKRR